MFFSNSNLFGVIEYMLCEVFEYLRIDVTPSWIFTFFLGKNNSLKSQKYHLDRPAVVPKNDIFELMSFSHLWHFEPQNLGDFWRKVVEISQTKSGYQVGHYTSYTWIKKPVPLVFQTPCVSRCVRTPKTPPEKVFWGSFHSSSEGIWRILETSVLGHPWKLVTIPSLV